MLVGTAKWSWLKAWAMKIARHRGMKKAIVALARRLAVIMHCHKLPSSALSRLLAHIEKCTIEWAPHREGSCMSGEGISTLAHRMINDVLRTSRRRFLTQVGAAGLGIGVPVSMTIAQETQRSLVGDGKEVSLGEKLARYATSLRYEDLPEDVIRIAKRTILDTLGCAFGGYSAGPSKIAMK